MTKGAATTGFAEVVMRDHSASVTTVDGKTRQVSAVTHDALQEQLVDVLLTSAEEAGGQLHVHMTGYEDRRFVIGADGAWHDLPDEPTDAPAVPGSSSSSSLSSPPPAVPAPTPAPARAEVNEGYHVRNSPEAREQIDQVARSASSPSSPSPAGSPTEEKTLGEGNLAMSQFAAEPATWGFKGRMNRRFGWKLRPNSDEVGARWRAAITAQRDEAARKQILQPALVNDGYCVQFTSMSEKGGVGKSTIACLLAMALAEVIQKPVALADLNPDKATTDVRMGVTATKSIMDLVANVDRILKHEIHIDRFMAKVESLPVSVLAGEKDQAKREVTSRENVHAVAAAFRPFYAAALLDNGTGISHQALAGSLDVSQAAVIVVRNSKGIEDYVFSSLDWLRQHGHADVAAKAVVAVIEQTPRPRMEAVDRRDQARYERALNAYNHAKARWVSGKDIAEDITAKDPSRKVIVFPHDQLLANADAEPIPFADLSPEIWQAARELAATLWAEVTEPAEEPSI